MTRLESIRNNAFLLGLNMTRATKEQKIQWLCQIIDNETDKPEDEIDFALIGECSAYLRELSDKAAEATKEQKRRILQQIKAHHNQTATKSAKILRLNWRKMGKIVAIAATVAALLLSSLTVLAKVNGYSNAWEYIKENAQKLLELQTGEKVIVGEITLIKGEECISYESVEALLEAEKYDILYPTILPNDIEITKISQQVMGEGYVIYSLQFTDVNLSVMVSNKFNISAEDLTKYEAVSFSNRTFYIKKLSNGLCQAVGYDGKYEYIISFNDYDKLIMILSGMKGLEQ